ncbi:MAG: glycosyltransferase family 4 protein [Candidatus Eisenbacteria bacterium]|uniref:Glycosyltransferase family 4 protein n=1 Tax=Eiseniibacteriota bacterium TaxID=2212470 RepID=A0A538T9V8_UNCEI|nr:MAG: glycosyltransferase family 4 protein [Candidatus Eisenbacteria bacterium]
MNPLHMALALPHLGVYGGIRRFLELGEIWIRRGHDVAILIPEGVSGQPWVPFSGAILPLSELPFGAWDVLLSPDPELFVASRAPGALRVFYSVLERAPFEERALRSADLVLANSAGMRRYLARRGVRAEDASGGVNVGFFRPPEGGRRAARTGEPAHVLVYGRVSRRRKGTWAAARAVERASAAAGVPVTLTLFDAPPDGAERPSLPRPLRIAHRWVLNPSQRELADLYGGADLFVSAERRAGWCNTAAEAMACGAALVCTRSGTEDFAVDGVTASVVRWRWSWALARAVGALLRDPDRRLALAARGRSKIQEFSWERTADRIERALEESLGGRSHAQGAARASR